jgi:hypothetical protein
LVIEPPLWKICVRQLRWWHSQCDGKNHPNVPNHQSVIVNDSMMVNTGWMMVNHGDQWWWIFNTNIENHHWPWVMIYEWVIFLLVYWRVFSEMDNRKYILNHPKF